MLEARVLWSAIALLMLAGCESSSRTPTEADAEAVWHHVAARNHVDTVRELVSLKKTDGHAATVQGSTIYTLSYEAKVRYLSPVGKWKPGDTQTVDSDYGFLKTENGWRGPDGTIYASK